MLASVSAKADEGDVFVLVDKESKLHDGDKVIIVSREHGVAMSKYQKGKYIESCSATLAGDLQAVTAVSDSACIVTVHRQAGGWRLQCHDDKWLWTSDGTSEELVFYPSETYYRNHTNVATLDFDTGSNCIIEFKKYNNRHYVKYNGNGRFGSYPNQSSVRHVQLYRMLSNHDVYDKIVLGENVGNSEALAESIDARVDTLVIDRTFMADGGLYSLCLPVDVDEADMRDAFGGAMFYRFSGIEKTTGETVVLHFRSAGSVPAGEPCMIRLAAGGIGDVVAPELYGRIVATSAPQKVERSADGINCTFVGTFDRMPLDADGRIRFISATGNKLVTPNGSGEFKALRGYFRLSTPGVATLPDTGDSELKCVLALDGVVCGSGTATNIVICNAVPSNGRSVDDAAYTMSGYRIANGMNMSLAEGIYVVGGKKVLRRQNCAK